MDDRQLSVTLTESQWREVLGTMMSSISERCWLALWIPGTQDDLPRLARQALATGAEQWWGSAPIGVDEAAALCAIADQLGYWVDWPEDDPRFVPHVPQTGG